MSVEQVQTQAVATFAADLTATAESLPTATATDTETPTPTATRTPTAAATAAATAGAVPTGSCYGLRYVSDVTIPDNSSMSPGHTFTKTWRVRNSGSCPWQAGFELRFTGGERMGGSAVALDSTVQAGAEVNVSVQLTAPTAPGTYRGNWRMTNASGTFFGDEIYVLIAVSGSTPSPTSGATAAPSPSPTFTPTESATETEVP